MEQYAEQVSANKLFKQFDYLIGYEDITQADVVQLKQLVLQIADLVGPYLDRIRETFQQYTEHDLRHLCNVADLVCNFLPKQKCHIPNSTLPAEIIRLNAVELAVLWLAILLHDAGMFVSNEEKEETLKSEEYLDYLRHSQDRVEAACKAREQGLEIKARTIEDALLAEYYRRLHPERVRSFITEKLIHGTLLGFCDISLINDIADLCESHAWGVREPTNPRHPSKCVARMEPNRRIKSFRVNLRYLACCLRLGDVLDFDRSRTPLSVYDEIDFTEESSVQEWNKHLSISGWHVDEHRALFAASCTHPAYYVSVHDFLNWVDEELRECRYLLDEAPAGDEERYSLTLAHATDRRQVRMSDSRYVAGGFRFQLEYEEIMRLLMDKSLYPDSSLFLRELLQNALDACRYQEALAKDADMADKYVPRIMVWDYSDDSVSPRIIFQDNGIGMSQRHVENFFLRIGKSFYRSPEFAAERQRLASHGIYLDACSQFGIGFLSCFLGGDLIEVETWRYGNAPLKITITGPSKYFLVERLPEPTGTIQFKSPKDALDDGPPRFPGTRITVFLKNNWQTCTEKPEKGIVNQTLETFAVNQEYDVLIYRGMTKLTEVIENRRWGKTLPHPCGCDVDKLLFFDRPADMLAFSSYIAPLEFKLEDYSSELKGKAAVWMLKGIDGEPTPECGLLALTGRSYRGKLAVRISSNVLSIFSDVCRLIDDADVEDRTAIIDFMIRDMLNGRFELDGLFDRLQNRYSLLHEIEEFVGNNEDDFEELTGKEKAQLVLLSSIVSKKPDIEIGNFNWYENADCLRLLANNDMTGLIKLMRQKGIPDFNRYVTLKSHLSLGLFGINVPGVIVDWDPAKGAAERITVLPSSVSMQVDTYGALAPKPSASRLFVSVEHSGELRKAIGRAILQFTSSKLKEHQANSIWKRWYKIFFDECSPIADAFFDNLVLINDVFELRGWIQGKHKVLTFREVIKFFGETAPIINEWGSVCQGLTRNPSQDGLFPISPYWLHNYFPRTILADGSEAYDFSQVRKKLGI